MSKFYPHLLGMIIASCALTACQNDATEELTLPDTPTAVNPSTQTYNFPADDGAQRLSYSPAQALAALVAKFDPDEALTMGETEATEAELAEIKAFVDKNLVGETTYDTYHKIFEWVSTQLTYANGDTKAYLRPYDVFKYRTCICQGYANLLKTMCLTQGIPVFIANGWLSNIGGHAWNYVYADKGTGGQWYVSDPTNHRQYELSAVSKYENELIPQSTDLDLFSDDEFAYDFHDGQFNIAYIEPTGEDFVTIPYSKAGWRITMFCPQRAVDDGITTVYLGKNIESLGNDLGELRTNFPSLSNISIDPDNTFLESFGGVVYYKGSDTPLIVPPAITRVELKPMKTVEKNTLYYLDNLEEVVVADGTQRIEAYAFEACPNLKTVYVPESVTYIDDNAVYRCGDDVQIVRVPTGIHEVTM